MSLITPSNFIQNRVFFEFDYGSFGYNSKFIDFRDPEKVVETFLLWCKTHLGKYERVFIIAHSMGGVIVRHACAKMLRSNNAEDKQLINKICKCFLLAVPLSGSWLARAIDKIPILSKLNKRIAYLAKPTVNGKVMSQEYKEALLKYQAEKGSWSLPKFHMFIGTDDKIVSKPHEEWCITDTDIYEGPVPGTHSSLKENIDVNSTLVQRIISLTNEAVASTTEMQLKKIGLVRESNRKRGEAMASDSNHERATGEGIDVILVSCSARKRDEGNQLYVPGQSIVEEVFDSSVGDLLIQTRSKVFNMIHQGQLDGIEFHEGNRIANTVNQDLYLGPDFGAPVNKSKFLPAYWRYRGRCYQATENEWTSFMNTAKRPRILIMSGLYGILTAEEYIQNYDCHLTDVDTETGLNLQSYWRDREFLTQVLISHIEWLEKNKGPVNKIIDLLSELSYEETIHWPMIYPRWPVYHRIFEKKSGRDSLENMGIWLRDIIRDPVPNIPLEYDIFYDNHDFFSEDRIAFEDRIGYSALQVTREV